VPAKRTSLLIDHVTPESVYTAKFEWLMRWAMHFCENDRQAAEDLVQDTFAQMLSSWESIRNLHQPEQFLYSCLRYGFLRQRRLGRRILMERLTSVDYESMVVSARQSRGQENEWQNELRRVVAFLCWRKEAIKSASLLLLRFFHGFFPAEIAKIAILPRTSVYDAIDYARQETKAHLSDPKKLQIMHHGTPPAPEFAPVLPADQFVEELLNAIFASRQSACMPPSALLHRYEGEAAIPIDSQLMAHLASCRICLDLVCRNLDLPPRGSRTLDETLSIAPKSKFGTSKDSASHSARARSLRMAQMMSEEAKLHRPRALILSVNGHTVAARDVRSAFNELVVELKGTETPEFIEVCSEQDLILLTAMVDSTPPQCPPEQVFSAELVDGRSLQLHLCINASGIQLRLTYVDPLYAQSARESLFVEQSAAPLENYVHPATGSRSILERFGRWLGSWEKPALATGLVAIVLSTSLIFLRRPSPMTPHSVLAHALQVAPGTGVERQTVRIRTREGSVVATLHRDAARQRKPKRDSVPEISPALEFKMAAAGMTWSDPLSAVPFDTWRAHRVSLTDTLSRSNGLVVLTTKTTEGDLSASSLTLRESDWHVVARTASFADGDTIEVAELDYSVVPWQKTSLQWFEAGLSSQMRAPAPLTKPKTEPLPSKIELDEAEVQVMLTLAQIDADSTERISVSRNPNVVSVSGAVATDARREQIQQLLAGIPHVLTNVLTFHEVDTAPPKTLMTEDATPKLTVADAPPASSPFDTWLLQQQYGLSEISRMHSILLASAGEMRQARKARSDLDQLIEPQKLSTEGKSRYEALQRLYLSRISHASEAEESLLRQLHVPPQAMDNPDEDRKGLNADADENAAICLQLISGNADPHDDPLTMLQRLAIVRTRLHLELQSAIRASTITSFTARSSEEAPLD